MAQPNAENTAVIACSMLRTEIEYIYEKHHLNYPIAWIEKGLHEYPDKLKVELEKHLPAYEDKDFIILIYGMCGYAVIGLESPHAVLAEPKFDDCVRMLMCCEQGKPIPTKGNHFYFTKEWTDSDKFILKEFERYIEDYGEEDGRAIADMMVGSYEAMDFIEDGTYDAAQVCASIAPAAAAYGLSCQCVQGTIRVLEKLLLAQWDDEILVVPPGKCIQMSDFDDRPRCI